jgi:hypothetical protein
MLLTKLLGYQEDGVKRLEAWNGRGLLGDSPGLGKTIQALAYLDRNSHALPAVVVSPAHLKIGWQRQARQHVGMDMAVLSSTSPDWGKVRNHKAVIINYEILTAWQWILQEYKPQTLIVDECFPYEAKVQTDLGLLPIGEIVNKRLPVHVASWDSSTNGIVFSPISHYVNKPRQTRIVTVFHEAGQLTCTEEHQVWTANRGYVKAAELSNADHLRVLRGEIHHQNQQNKREEAEVLFKKLCLQSHHQNERSQTLTRSDSKNGCCQEEMVRNGSGVVTQIAIIKTDDGKQPRLKTRSDNKNDNHEAGQRHPSYLERGERGQRKTDTTTKTIKGETGRGMGTGTTNQDPKEKGQRLSDFLQGRSREYFTHDSHRDRRKGTPYQEKEIAGYQEGGVTCLSRVVCVEIHERPNNDQSHGDNQNDQTVYCLTVEPNHNFFVEGVMVHNCQYVSNHEADRTLSVRELARGVPHFIAISGTPITNRPIEFWSVLNMIDPEAWPSRHRFGHHFCAPRRNPFSGGWDFKGCTNAKELHALLTDPVKGCMIRRLKEDVLKDLPPKIVSTVPLKLRPAEIKEYRLAQTDLRSWLRANFAGRPDGKARAQALEKVNVLRQLTARLKLPHVIKWVETFLESGEKLILFGNHRAFVRECHEAFAKKSVMVYGGVSSGQKQEAFDRFNNSKDCRLFVGNNAASTGWSAFACSNVAHGEFPWQPAEVLQRTDRAHGIGRGQVGIPTSSWMLCADETIDLKMVDTLAQKESVLGQVLDGEDWFERTDGVFEAVCRQLMEAR